LEFMPPAIPKETSVNELILALGLLVRRIRSATPSEAHDLSWTQRAVISRLDKHGPATIADLARSERVKPQSMGTAITLLEDLGMIQREPHPTDGRQVNIRLSPQGAQLRKSMRALKHTWLSQAISQLDKDEQATLFKAGKIIKRLAEL
jgi:DNA-binding MarR family transcriptional regulator